MANYDLFELIPTLPFDTPANNTQEHTKAIAAIKKKIRDVSGEINNAHISEKPTYIAQRDFLKVLLSADESTLDAHAFERLKQTKSENVKQAFKSSFQTIKAQTVTEQYVKSCSDRTRLSEQSIRQILTELGFEIVSFDFKMPEFSDMKEIESHMTSLRKFGNDDPRHADLCKIMDLYDFFAYINGNLYDAPDFRSRPFSGELSTTLQEYAGRYSGAQPEPRKTCVLIAAPASTHIFNTRENKEKYDNYSRYNSPEMIAIRTQIQALPEATLRMPEVADDLIMKIERIMNSKDYALAIYNNVAGFRKKGKDPYVQQSVKFYIECGHCATNLSYSNRTERDKAQTCPNCQKPLYRQCRKPDCKQMVLVALDKCPNCGLGFDSAAEFQKHIAKADEARRTGNFDEARQHLVRAKASDPSETVKTSELENKINSDELRYQEPVNNLRKLVAAKKYHTAANALANIIDAYPMLNVASYEAEIKSILTRVQSYFDGARNRTPSERADICLDILNYCVDYAPALQLLKTTQPIPIRNLSITVDTVNCFVMVNWARSNEKGITYRVVRKEGRDIPSNERDGVEIKDNISDTSIRDETATPGKSYSYAVFAKRMEVFSIPTGSTMILAADVTNAGHEQNGKMIRLTWNIPRNSTGVTVVKEHNGRSVVLSENAQTSYEDRHVEYGDTYVYTLKVNYHGIPPSRGIYFPVTPLVQVDDFQISASHVKDNTYRISWGVSHNNIDLRVLVDGQVVRQLKSDMKNCEISLPRDGFHIVDVAAYSGGTWLSSINTIEINTYMSCEIDRSLSRISEKAIDGTNMYRIDFNMIMAEPIPRNAVAFWYVVRTKSLSQQGAPWEDANGIANAHDAFKVSMDTYREKRELTFTTTIEDEDAFYVSMFTIYNTGAKEVISAPYKRKFMRPLEAHIQWKVVKPLFGKAKLTIELTSNRSISKRPQMILCACPPDTHLVSHTSPKAVTVAVVNEEEYDVAGKHLKWDIEIPSSNIPKGSKLFLFQADPSDDNETLVVSWASEFRGRV